MNRLVGAVIVVLVAFTGVGAAASSPDDGPTVYVIQKGDTLWGLSQRFLKDPYYWPDLWSRNQSITNPHLIVPGQKVRIFPDRIEVEPPAKAAEVPKAEQPAPIEQPASPKEPVKEETAKETTFFVSGAEGFLLENKLQPAGYIISTHQNRAIVGEDDIVYTDVGRQNGAKPGDKFDIFRKTGPISHPITNVILGYQVIPLGTLQLSEVEEKVSKAIITKSYQELGAGSFIMPHRERRREIALRAATKELSGYIVETRTGNKIIAAGDIVFIDLGRKQGAEPGNVLYVVREVEPDQKFIDASVGKLPDELIGALVVVDAGENTSTALVVKSIDTIYPGNRVAVQRSK